MGASNIKEGMSYSTKRFGNVIVLKYTGKYNILIRFIETGTTITVKAAALRSGTCEDRMSPSVHGVGYLGYGKFTTNLDLKKSRCYNYWCRMLKRCYAPHGVDYKDYGAKGVTVCEDWHNFQNFAKWFHEQENHNRVGYHLDKDLLVRGNKVYCPERCILIPAEINTLGIFRVADKFCLTTSGKWRYNVYGMGKHSKSYECKDDCRKAYFICKKEGMIKKINHYFNLGEITESFYNHLLSLIQEIYTDKGENDEIHY